MRYGSVCSGIEAATVAWHHLGWEPAFFSEIEAAPSAVLAHHYPEVPLHGDFTTIGKNEYGKIDLLVGGTPCQSFSVAGLRGGLADDRGNLALEFCRLAQREQPRWIVWENVPGVLSSSGGRDFGSILGALEDLGYGLAYRVLDAQFFGVPQRRRRVFVVGYLGDWRRAAAVLFERHSLSGHPAPRREKGEGTSGRVADSLTKCRAGSPDEARGTANLIPSTGQTAHCLNAGGMGRQDFETKTLIAHAPRGAGFDASEDGTGRGTPLVPVAFSIMPMNSGKDFKARETDVAQPIMAGGPVGGNQGGDYIVPIDMRQASRGATMTNNRAEGSSGGAPGTGIGEAGDPSPTVSTSHVPAICFSAKDHGADAMEDCSPTLRAGGFTKSHADAGVMPAVCLAGTAETMYGVSHADASQTHPDQALRALRDAVGAEAYSEWCLGILAAFRTPEVLRSKVHGRSVRWARDDWHKLGDDALSRPQDGAAWPMLTLWQAGCVGRSPRGWQPPERLARELVAHLSELPRQRASAARFLLGLWRASEGLGLLREALSALQEAWRPEHREDQSARLTSAVRRLTPIECERLMGFPDGFTLVPYRNKLMADGPRYKALGNSMAVPVMRWIGERIALVNDLTALL